MIFAFAKIVRSVQCAVFRGMNRKTQVSSLKKKASQSDAHRNHSSFTIHHALRRDVAEQRQPKFFTLHSSLYFHREYSDENNRDSRPQPPLRLR